MAIVQVKAISMGRFSWNVDQPATITAKQRIGSVTSFRAGDILFIIDTSGTAPIV